MVLSFCALLIKSMTALTFSTDCVCTSVITRELLVVKHASTFFDNRGRSYMNSYKQQHLYEVRIQWSQCYLDAHNLCILLVLKPKQQQIQRINDQRPTLGILLCDDADVLLTRRVNGKTLHIQMIHIGLIKQYVT